MDQNNKQNTSGQASGGDLPPLSGTGVNTPGVDTKPPKKISTDGDLPVKPKTVKPEVAKVSVTPDEVGGGLPPLDTAEDETFNPGIVKKKEEAKDATLPPLPGNDVGGTNEGLKEVKEMGEVNSENQETPPPPPPEESPIAPGKTEDKPLTTEGIDMGDDGGEKKKGKKKINKKTIAGAVIALVLLIGVPVLALNLGYFRGDVRERAALHVDPYPDECIRDGNTCGGEGSPDKRCCTPSFVCAVVDENTGIKKCIKKVTPTLTSTPAPKTPTPTLECIRDGNTCGGEGSPDKTCCTSSFVCAVVDENTGIKKCIKKVTPTATPWTPSPDECVKDGECLQPGLKCCPGWTWEHTKPTDDIYCYVTETRCVSGGTVTPTKTPTKKPTVGICVDIKIYTLQDGVWTVTSAAEVGQHASVGDTIRLAVKGNSSAFINGRFRVAVSGVAGNWVTTNTKNGNGELYLDYLLENGGSHSVEGEIRK